MAFDLGLWSDGATPLLVVCEEAHRYMAADHSSASRRPGASISRIAKEGRKYGVFLGLVTQRPAELDPTILSQCSTLFAMRMTNDRDQELLRSAVADTAANCWRFCRRSAPARRLRSAKAWCCRHGSSFSQLPAHMLPRSDTMSDDQPDIRGRSTAVLWRLSSSAGAAASAGRAPIRPKNYGPRALLRASSPRRRLSLRRRSTRTASGS